MLNLFKKIKNTINFSSNSPMTNFINKNDTLTEKDKQVSLSEKVGDTRNFPPATKEWTNSVYSYNKTLTKTLPSTDNIVNRLIKSYFSLTPLFRKKKSKRVEIRFRRLSLNRMLVSKAEMKHTNNKVIITVYLYNKNKKFLISKLKDLYKTFILKTSIIKNKVNARKKVNLALKSSALKQKNKSTGLKGNTLYKSLSLSKAKPPISYAKYMWNGTKLVKINSKIHIKIKPNFKANDLKTKRNFTTKRKNPFNKVSSGLNPKVYNYVNFTNLTRARLTRFLYKFKNVNLKNKYKTLVGNYYSMLNNYKLYSKGGFAVNENTYLNLSGKVINNNMYASTFYKIFKMNNQGVGLRTKRKNLTAKNRALVLNRKGSRKIKNLMHKLRNLYKLFTLSSTYNYLGAVGSNTGIVTNLQVNGFKLRKMLKKTLVSKAVKRINFITLKSVNIIKRARKNKNFIMKTLNWTNENFTKYESKYYKRFIKKAYKKEMLYLYYVRMLSFNNNKLKNWFLLGLKKVLSKIYKKNVEFNLVSLKYLHLNSDIFTESIAVKLKNRHNRLLSVLKKALTLVKLPRGKNIMYKGSGPSVASKIQKNKLKPLNINSFGSESAISETNNDSLHKLLLNIFTNNVINSSHSSVVHKAYATPNQLVQLDTQQKDVLDSIKYKTVFGVRLEAAGRLSKRLIASRSVFKLKYKGNLKNIDSSYKGISSVILKGNTKSNIQYTKISSKTRNGSFGLKGWVSGN